MMTSKIPCHEYVQRPGTYPIFEPTRAFLEYGYGTWGKGEMFEN
jgi:hypothetical protein